MLPKRRRRDVGATRRLTALPDVVAAPATVPRSTPSVGVAAAGVASGDPIDPLAASRAGYDMAVRLSGPFDVVVAGRPVESWRSQKAASILKFLLLRDLRPVRREVLMDAFWPHSSPKAARGNLNVSVYSLRSVLRAIDPGRTYVIFRDGAYGLNPSLRYWVDARAHAASAAQGHLHVEAGESEAAVRSYRHAQALCQGELLEGDASGTWPDHERRRFEEDHRVVLERLAVVLLDVGAVTESVAVARDLVAEDPCHEPAHQVLMRAYAALDQRQLVVRQYRECVDQLRRDLAVEPGASTQELFRRLVG